MNLRGILYGTTPGYDEPGEAGVCSSCKHTPTKPYQPSWIDKLTGAAGSTQRCTAKDDGANPSGHPEPCLCADSYHYRHFL